MSRQIRMPSSSSGHCLGPYSWLRTWCLLAPFPVTELSQYFTSRWITKLSATNVCSWCAMQPLWSSTPESLRSFLAKEGPLGHATIFKKQPQVALCRLTEWSPKCNKWKTLEKEEWHLCSRPPWFTNQPPYAMHSGGIIAKMGRCLKSWGAWVLTDGDDGERMQNCWISLY